MTDFQKTLSVDLPAIAVDPALFSFPVGARFRDDFTVVSNVLAIDADYEDFLVVHHVLAAAIAVTLQEMKPGNRVGLVTRQSSGNAFTGALWDNRIIWQNGVAGSFTTGVGRPSGKNTYDYTELLCVQELVAGTPATGILLGRQVKNFPVA